jgi:phage-related protein
MPETFGAIGNLLSKVGSTVLKVGKVLFTWWLAPIKQVWHLITSVGTAIKGAFLAGVGAVKSFFGLIDAKFQFIKSIVTHVFTALIHVFDHFLASIVNGISNVGSKIANALKHPFRTAWSGVKKLWGGHSPSQIGLSILKGIQSVGGSMHKSLTQPFSKGMDWIMSKIPGLRKMFNVLHGGGNAGSIETKAQAAYIPAVTVSPTGAKIAGQTPPPQAKSNDDKKSSATLDDVLAALNTQNKLLGQLLAKDTSVNLDGSLISTQLSRGISFKGNYGVNK